MGKGATKGTTNAFDKSMIGAPIQSTFVHVSHLGKLMVDWWVDKMVYC